MHPERVPIFTIWLMTLARTLGTETKAKSANYLAVKCCTPNNSPLLCKLSLGF